MSQGDRRWSAWWGMTFDCAAVPAAFAGGLRGAGLLIGCYREMRLELKMRNGPLVWLGVSRLHRRLCRPASMRWLSHRSRRDGWDAVALALGARAAMTYAALTYLMVLLEPKDRVHLPLAWQPDRVRRSRRVLGRAAGLDDELCRRDPVARWRCSVVAGTCTGPTSSMHAGVVAAPLGFLTRDVAIFVCARRCRAGGAAISRRLARCSRSMCWCRRSSDGLGVRTALMLFFRPTRPTPVWLGAVSHGPRASRGARSPGWR